MIGVLQVEDIKHSEQEWLQSLQKRMARVNVLGEGDCSIVRLSKGCRINNHRDEIVGGTRIFGSGADRRKCQSQQYLFDHR